MDKNLSFSNSMHRLGKITTAIAVLVFVLVPFTTQIVFGLKPSWSGIVTAFVPTFLAVVPGGLAFIFSTAPIMGSGQYITTLTGNISNLKLPAALNAIKLLETEPGTEEAEIASCIGVAVSTIVNITILTMGVLFLAPIVEPILNNPIVKPGFDNLVPAVFGAVVAPFMLKSPKLLIFAIGGTILAGVLGFLSKPIGSLLLFPIAMITTIGLAILLEKAKAKKTSKEVKS